uniref:Uncharacterized protein n=1 Tax=Anguilla anguilla TaxID=7936 RepID=A0A0E9Q3K5_ANGAN
MIYLHRWRGGIVGLFCQRRMATHVVSFLWKKRNEEQGLGEGTRRVATFANQK